VSFALVAIKHSEQCSFPQSIRRKIITNKIPKTEDEKYAYDIIQKAYWINEKKIEMLDYKKRNKLIEDYYEKFKNT
jgi:Fe-S cluster biosynthesis and repair protein YggX